MHYVLYSDSGNMLDSFESLSDAQRALNDLVRHEPESRDKIAVVVYDLEGEPTGEAVLPDDPTLPHATIRPLAGTSVLFAASGTVRGVVEATRRTSNPAELGTPGIWEPAATEAPKVALTD